MATGDILCVPELVPVTGSPATQDFRNGGATVDISMPVLGFDAASIEYAGYRGMMPPAWNGVSIKVRFAARASSATTGGMRFEAAFRRMDAADDLDATHTYSWQGATVAAPGTSGYPAYGEITFTQAQADSLAGGEEFALLLRRKTDDAADDMTGDAEVSALVIAQA